MPERLTALRIVLFMAVTTVSLAHLASRFQVPQPPIDWRVQPVSGYGSRCRAGSATSRSGPMIVYCEAE